MLIVGKNWRIFFKCVLTQDMICDRLSFSLLFCEEWQGLPVIIKRALCHKVSGPFIFLCGLIKSVVISKHLHCRVSGLFQFCGPCSVEMLRIVKFFLVFTVCRLIC